MLRLFEAFVYAIVGFWPPIETGASPSCVIAATA
jgi:hypothetical protein